MEYRCDFSILGLDVGLERLGNAANNRTVLREILNWQVLKGVKGSMGACGKTETAQAVTVGEADEGPCVGGAGLLESLRP